MDIDNRCTILVNSCDINTDLWDPLFRMLYIQSGGIKKYPIVLNTETVKYHSEYYDIRVINQVKEGIEWGRRLKDCLKRIKTKYVFTLLDDIYPLKPIDTAVFEECMDWMDKDPGVAVFYLGTTDDFINDHQYPGFSLCPQVRPYKLTTRPAIWNTECLMRYARNHESIWEFETLGSVRAGRYKEKFYGANGERPLAFEYSSLEYGIRRGRWLPKTKGLFEEHGIEVDYSKRGFINPDDPYRYTETYSIKEHFPRDVIKPVFWKEIGNKIVQKSRNGCHVIKSLI